MDYQATLPRPVHAAFTPFARPDPAGKEHLMYRSAVVSLPGVGLRCLEHPPERALRGPISLMDEQLSDDGAGQRLGAIWTRPRWRQSDRDRVRSHQLVPVGRAP